MRDAGIPGQPVALESTRQTVPAVACADGDNDGRSRKAPRIRIVETKTFVFFHELFTFFRLDRSKSNNKSSGLHIAGTSRVFPGNTKACCDEFASPYSNRTDR